MTAVGDMSAAPVEAEDDALAAPERGGLNFAMVRRNWALALVLVCAALTGPIGYAGQLGYAALIGLAGIASLPMLGVKRPSIPEIFILLALALWCCAAMAWSVYSPGHDFHKYKQIEGLTAIKLVLELALYGAFVFLMREMPERWAGRIMATLCVGLILISVLMAVDALTNQSVYRGLRLSAHAAGREDMIESKAARGCYTIALLYWPAALWMRRAGWNLPLAAMTLCFLIAAIGLKVDAPIVAVVLSGIALFAVRQLGRSAIWTLLVGTMIYFALAPTVVDIFSRYLPAMHADAGVAKASWGARVDIWRFAAAHITEKPWLGWGMDASRVWTNDIPLHPHDAAIQIWLELGVIGVVLAALFWSWLWARIGAVSERNASNGGIAAAVAVAYLTIGALSFGVWQEWWIALGVVGVMVAIAFSKAFKDWIADDRSQELTPLA